MFSVWPAYGFEKAETCSLCSFGACYMNVVLSEVMCWMKWCVDEAMCWVKWCVEWSDVVLSEVMCWVKRCVEWSDVVLSEMVCWVKWYSCFFSICSFSWTFLFLCFLYPFFLILTTVYLLAVAVDGYCRTFSHSDTPHKIGRTPLDEWSVRCTDLYLTKHNTHNRLTPMLLAGFEPPTPATERPLGRAFPFTVCVNWGAAACLDFV